MSGSTTLLPFTPIAPNLAMGTLAPAGWQRINALPLVILVGVTGVGKSTLLAEFSKHIPSFLLLPDRRQLTDQLIINYMQAMDGVPILPVTDRSQRFAYTRRYREQHPSGMAHALAQLWISTKAPAALLVFDGLRGDNEVAYAADALPQARFVMLDAPDVVRVQRLLQRGDAFDRINLNTPTNIEADAASFADLGVPEAATIFTAAEEQMLFGAVQHGIVSSDDLRAKLQIVIEERRSYDPAATLAALQTHAPERTLYLDTVTHRPDAVAAQTIAWLNL
jgi:hypothetical protein